MTKIGIDFSVKKSDGGAYQYSLTFLDVIKKNSDDEFIIFNSSSDLPVHSYKDNFKIIDLSEHESGQNKFINLFKEWGYRFLLFLRLYFLID